LVVPKRALLIQSIVNLKILKKEADQMNLQLMIVTQDKLGKLLIEKAGILVQQNMDDLPEEEISEGSTGVLGRESKNSISGSDYAPTLQKGRLDKIGSDHYFDEKTATPINVSSLPSASSRQDSNQEGERLLNKELVSDIGREIKRAPEAMSVPVGTGAAARRMGGGPMEKRNPFSMDVSRSNAEPRRDVFEGTAEKTQTASSYLEPKDKKIENFFYHNNQNNNLDKREDFRRERQEMPAVNLHGKFKKFALIFGLVGLVVFAASLGYLFIPKAVITLAVRTQAKSSDSQVKGDTKIEAINYEAETIPVKLVSADQSVTQTFAVSGTKSGAGQKAHGTITVYNEFSPATQQLVATTRFLDESGKIFRLTKSIVVPGTTKVNGETKPGAIEAEVVADGIGEEYNIGPSKFTIPGFKESGGDKYNKFYAKSTKTMESGGNNKGEAKVVSETDVANAKVQLISQLNEAIKQKLMEASGEGSVILDDAVNKEEAVYRLSNSPGDAVENFQVTAQIKANAFVFKEADMKNLVAKIISKSGEAGEIDGNSVALEYGKTDADFKAGTVNVRLHAKGKIPSAIDFDNLKREILGKNEEDLGEYLRTYSEIEKAEVTYWPTFMAGRIPMRESRVELILDNQ